MQQRLDMAMLQRGLEQSRERAKALIMSGIVYVNGQRCDKAGQGVHEKDQIEIRGNKMPYVSRGGYKLEKAIDVFDIDLQGAICMDIGASTGGFTDCMLQNGAKKVYSVDVGYGQLAWSLRTDDRVVNLERTNIRYLETIDDVLDFVSIDVSFISLKLVLPVAYRFLNDDGKVLALIKPQFEAGREQVGKKGVVRDKQVHLQVIKQVCNYATEYGFVPYKLDYSPIKGPEGNIEYLICLCKDSDIQPFALAKIETVVLRSHSELGEQK